MVVTRTTEKTGRTGSGSTGKRRGYCHTCRRPSDCAVGSGEWRCQACGRIIWELEAERLREEMDAGLASDG